MIEPRQKKSIDNSPTVIKEGIKFPNNWDVKTNAIMTHDTFSLFDKLYCPKDRARHPFTRTFIVITCCLFSFSIMDCNTVDLGSIIE